jgi:hypothetical protein
MNGVPPLGPLPADHRSKRKAFVEGMVDRGRGPSTQNAPPHPSFHRESPPRYFVPRSSASSSSEPTPRPVEIRKHMTDPQSNGASRFADTRSPRVERDSRERKDAFRRRGERKREPEFVEDGPSYRSQGTKREVKMASRKKQYKSYSQR